MIEQKKISREQRQQANRIARLAGYGRATEVIIGTANRVAKHEPWGFATDSGKFFTHVRSTKWYGSGHYERAVTVVEIDGKKQ
jgi:hypothetical protein